MHRCLQVLVLTVVAAVTGVGHTERSPLSAQLEAAFRRGDRVRLASLGTTLSARGLGPILASERAAQVRAAIAAAPAAEDAWELLDDLAALAEKPDRQLAAPAAHTAVVIAEDLTLSRIEMLEIPPSALLERAVRWRNIAMRAGVWPDVRVLAIQVNLEIARLMAPGDRAAGAVPLAGLAGDEEPEIRRAAIELWPQPLSGEGRDTVGEVLRNESDPLVAVVAGQALCGGLRFKDDAAAILSAATPVGLERIRDLVVNPSLPVAARLESAECLRKSGTPADIKALHELEGSVPKRLLKGAPKERSK